ncbi:MAG: AraC family transcriptional regulator [Pseudomonadales bacterium]|nr:AraC family transcriptional regulator [Pseudomonadales bacterium]MBP6228679.1 AraC family transcriptional regulator [Pseudomonadales bacterium]
MPTRTRDTLQPNEQIPTQFACSLLRMLSDHGLDVAEACASAGLDFDPLDPGAPGYRSEIPIIAYSRLYRGVMTALQDETFGLRRDVGMNPGAFRMMCYCVLGCPNLGRAIRRLCEFHRVFFDHKLVMRLHRQDDGARFEVLVAPEAQLDGPQEPGAMMSAVQSACCLSMWHRFFGWLIGRPLPLANVSLCGTAPGSRLRYQQLFNCDLGFGAAVPGFSFPSEYLAYPLVHNEDSLLDFLRTAPYQLLIMPADPGKLSLVDQVRSLIGHDFSRGFPSFERITDLLHMSAPTLRRRLKREGTTFQELKDNCRRDASIAYLNRPELSINDVAILMGFTDPSAFYRSFKKWTGLTPGEFRAQQAL